MRRILPLAFLAALLLPTPAHADRGTPPPCDGYTCPSPTYSAPPATSSPTPAATTPATQAPTKRPAGVKGTSDAPAPTLPTTGKRSGVAVLAGVVAVGVGVVLLVLGRRRGKRVE